MSLSQQILNELDSINKKEEYSKIIDSPVKIVISSAQLRRLLDTAFNAKSEDQLNSLVLSASNMGHPIESDSDLDQCIFESSFIKSEKEEDEVPVEEDITGVTEAPLPETPVELVEEREVPTEQTGAENENSSDEEKKKPSQEELNKITNDKTDISKSEEIEVSESKDNK